MNDYDRYRMAYPPASVAEHRRVLAHPVFKAAHLRARRACKLTKDKEQRKAERMEDKERARREAAQKAIMAVYENARKQAEQAFVNVERPAYVEVLQIIRAAR